MSTLLITEFGEELGIQEFRLTISETAKNLSTCSGLTILPADVGLSITLYNDRILCRCSLCGNYIPVTVAQLQEKAGFISYSYKAGCTSGFEHLKVP